MEKRRKLYERIKDWTNYFRKIHTGEEKNKYQNRVKKQETEEEKRREKR